MKSVGEIEAVTASVQQQGCGAVTASVQQQGCEAHLVVVRLLSLERRLHAQKRALHAPSSNEGGGGTGIKNTSYAAFCRVFGRFCPRSMYFKRDHIITETATSVSQPDVLMQQQIVEFYKRAHLRFSPIRIGIWKQP